MTHYFFNFYILADLECWSTWLSLLFFNSTYNKMENDHGLSIIADCVEKIDAQQVFGYALFKDGKHTRLSYPLEKFHSDIAGRSFHNGRFIQRMREKASSLPKYWFLPLLNSPCLLDINFSLLLCSTCLWLYITCRICFLRTVSFDLFSFSFKFHFTGVKLSWLGLIF
jgi:hypothetical protein